MLRSLLRFSLGTALSRVTGFLREVGLAYFLGATPWADAFYVAFRIPNLFRDLLAENAVQTAFVPLLVQRMQRGDPLRPFVRRVFFSLEV
ncbi:MAG: hypothetical protein L3J76_00560 [Candidatus Hydrothermae bacterium]|nr:hypothetical protein [Candidatus Hydrothermae bacterium]